MAKKSPKQIKKTVKQGAEDTSVVRIRASSASTRKPKVPTLETQSRSVTKIAKIPKLSSVTTTKLSKVRKLGRPAKATGGYFKGAWTELRQVRWPNRRATWSMTFAVLLYTTFFVILVLLLDAGFKYFFELMLGK